MRAVLRGDAAAGSACRDEARARSSTASGCARGLARKAAAERAMDEVRQKFGKRALETGLVFDDHRRRGK